MPHYRRVGDIPRKRHTVFGGEGSGTGGAGRLAEELVGQLGFAGASSLLYHRGSPSALVRAEAFEASADAPAPNEAVLPWHFRLPHLAEGDDPVRGRHVLLGNGDITLAWASAPHGAVSPLYRAAAGDELVFVLGGRATLESVYGRLDAGPGDYVVIPASATHRWRVGPGDRFETLVLQATGHVGIPERYLTATGQLREGAPYSERDLRAPGEPLLEGGEDVEVLVRHRHGWARHVYATHPFDVVGWDGCVYPYKLAIRDFEPITGRLHQPPPVHQTFAGPGCVVCSFVPRLLDTDPDAVRVPYHHANTDSDEVLVYVEGDFGSRKGAGIAPGSMTLHPAGFVHGPQPGSYEASLGRDRTDELAVMIDTFAPLGVSAAARSVADPGYPASWWRPPEDAPARDQRP